MGVGEEGAGLPRAAKWFLCFPRSPHKSTLMPDLKSSDCKADFQIKLSGLIGARGVRLHGLNGILDEGVE